MKYAQTWRTNLQYRQKHRVDPIKVILFVVVWGLVVYQLITY